MNVLKDEKKDTKQGKLSESSDINLLRLKLSLPDEAAANVGELKSTRKAQAFANSPVGYTLSHLLDVNQHGCSQQSTPVSSRLDDSLDITIYWADKGGLKISLVGGKLATASSLLFLLSDHLDIDADIFKQVCALWMVSDLLEVQLKPHHNPYEIRKNWIQFLQRFTNAESSESIADEPLLVLKRNVQLSVGRERELEEDYTNEVLTEILYRSAKQEVLSGRYICDIDLSIKLATLQMAIELEPNEDLELDLFGAAFFRGYIERPVGGPLKEIKKMILSVTLPDIPVLFTLNTDYRFEVAISATVLSDCPCFLLTFPDASFLTDPNSETEVLKFPEKIKMLQVFSKQAIMIEALINSLSKLLERNGDGIMLNVKYNDCQKMAIVQGELLDLEGTVSSNNSSNDKSAYVTNISVNEHNLQQNYGLEFIDSRSPSSSTSSHTDEQTKGNGSGSRSVTDVYNLPSPFMSNVDKLCLATLDADGHCLEAQGSLRVLLKVM
uniref:FERM domain-containing protein n=1 Tax=Onchocerca volvulus TaxID=6282 RepID=A0A8R1TYZ8_ONCVO